MLIVQKMNMRHILSSKYKKITQKYLHQLLSRWKKISSIAYSRYSKTIHQAKKHRNRIVFTGIILIVVVAPTITSGVWWFIQTKQQSVARAESIFHFGAIGDFEYGTRINVGNKLTRQARGELEKVISFYNDTYRPIFAIELGDMIESSGLSPEKAKKQFRDINAVFQTVNARREYVIGNHDLYSLSKAEVREILGLDDNHRFFDEGDWRFVIMDTNFDEEADRGASHTASGHVSRNEYAWLETAIKTDRPTIVFSHHPISPGRKNTNNYQEIRSLFERHPNVVLSISGHDPSFRFSEEDGVHYLVVDNLANIDSLGSFATLDTYYNPLTKEARVVIEHYGPTRRTVEAKKIISTDRKWWVDALDRFKLLP